MTLEHLALNVPDPVAMAAWYAEHLGFVIRRASGEPPFAHFIQAPGSTVMMEIYHNPAAPVPAYSSLHPSAMHIAFWVDDVPAELSRLLAAGATREDVKVATTDAGDQFVIVRDPWGIPLQLLRRATPLVPRT